MRRRKLILLFALLVGTTAARADILLLVHGWRSDADTWLRSGVVQALAASGWRDAGVLAAGPQGLVQVPPVNVPGANRIFRAELPAAAALPLQASLLEAEIGYLRRRYPRQRLVVAGHSAGGVVARLALVRPGAPRVDALVTIAAPNLGTGRAVEGLEVVNDKPFFCPGPGIDFLKHMLGGSDYDYLEYSRPALAGLTPAVPGSLIDWLNRQRQPAVAYYAVIHGGPRGDGDGVVPAASQDLNDVPALRGRAAVYAIPAGHGLNPADGWILARIVAG